MLPSTSHLWEHAPCCSGLLYLSWAVHVGGSHGNAAALGGLGGALATMHSCLLFSQAPERRKKHMTAACSETPGERPTLAKMEWRQLCCCHLLKLTFLLCFSFRPYMIPLISFVVLNYHQPSMVNQKTAHFKKHLGSIWCFPITLKRQVTWFEWLHPWTPYF